MAIVGHVCNHGPCVMAMSLHERDIVVGQPLEWQDAEPPVVEEVILGARTQGTRLGRPQAWVPVERVQTVSHASAAAAARMLGVSRSTLKRWRRVFQKTSADGREPIGAARRQPVGWAINHMFSGR